MKIFQPSWEQNLVIPYDSFNILRFKGGPTEKKNILIHFL